MTLTWYRAQYTKILLLFALFGVVCGYWSLGPSATVAHHVARLFVNMLELLSLPLIFLSIVATISGMSSVQEMKKLGAVVLKYTLLTTIVAATVGLVLYLLINPTAVVDQIETVAGHASATGSYLNFLTNMIPSNLVQLFASNSNVTAVVFFSLLLSFSILSLPDENKQVLHSFFASLFAAMLQIAQFVILLLPLGVWAFVVQFFASIDGEWAAVMHLVWYSVCVIGANVIQGFVVLPALLWFKGIAPRRFARQVSDAVVMAFFSKSSNTTLPVTMACATEKAKISKRVASFTLPLCSTINMNGCAAFMLITVLFVATSHGVSFGWLDMVSWIFIVTAAAVGNAGVPMGCYFLTSAFLASMNVPLYLLGAILPLYTFFDMVETALNVWSDLVVAAVVDKEVTP